MKNFKCNYENECETREIDPEKCKICKLNTRRNYKEDHFQ